MYLYLVPGGVFWEQKENYLANAVLLMNLFDIHETVTDEMA